MHPVIVQAMAAEHIKSMTSMAEKARLARLARRARQRTPAGRTVQLVPGRPRVPCPDPRT